METLKKIICLAGLVGLVWAINYLPSDPKMNHTTLIAPRDYDALETEFKSAEPKKATKAKVKHSEASPLQRFEKWQEKVLLSQEETKEREQTLSDLKIVEWISKRLMDSSRTVELKERLSLIDFLEASLVWKDNPVRKDVLASIKLLILSDSYMKAPRDINRQLVGDKIELFAILSQEFPEEASALSEQAHGTNLEAILNFATSRLSLRSIKTEE